jgi:hypothetical protein
MERPTPKMPTRMSKPRIEDTKPSKLIAVFWWFVFIVPVGFVWWSTNSIAGVLVLIALRILIMYIPKFWKKEQVVVKEESPAPIQISENVNTTKSSLSPYIDEAKSEWNGFLKLMKIYDKDKEEKNLVTYRKLRGWE